MNMPRPAGARHRTVRAVCGGTALRLTTLYLLLSFLIAKNAEFHSAPARPESKSAGC